MEPDVGKYEQRIPEVICSFGDKHFNHLLEVLGCHAGLIHSISQFPLVRSAVISVYTEICHDIVKCL